LVGVTPEGIDRDVAHKMVTGDLGGRPSPPFVQDHKLPGVLVLLRGTVSGMQ